MSFDKRQCKHEHNYQRFAHTVVIYSDKFIELFLFLINGLNKYPKSNGYSQYNWVTFPYR